MPNPNAAAFLRLLGRSTRLQADRGRVRGPPDRPAARPLAHPLRRTGRGPRLGPAAADDDRAGRPLGDRPVRPRGRQPGRAARLDRPARRPDRARRRPGWPRTRSAARRPARSPTRPSTTRCSSGGSQAITGRDRAGRRRRPSPARRRRWTPRCARQLEPTWELMWRGASPCWRRCPRRRTRSGGGRPTAGRSPARSAWLREGGAPQPRRDSAVAAARRLARLEREQQRLAVERAYDDPLVMAEYRLTGEAFAGTVVDGRPDPARHRAARRPSSAPWLTVRDHRRGHRRAWRGAHLPRTRPGSRDGQRSCRRVRRHRRRPAETTTTTTTTATPRRHPGHPRAQAAAWAAPWPPRPAPSPAVGDEVTYTTLRDDFQPAPQFPSREDTPWTHGGPPPEYVPTDDDAQEDGHEPRRRADAA